MSSLAWANSSLATASRSRVVSPSCSWNTSWELADLHPEDKLVSKAFDNGETIPAEYLKDEDNISPVTLHKQSSPLVTPDYPLIER